MKEKKATHYVVASLDSIAWLFNIRGNDIPQTPVVYAYAVVEMDTARIFIPDGKFEAVEGAEIYPYDAVYGYLQNLQRGTLIYDPGAVSVKLAGAIPSSVTKQPEEEDIIALLKAVKNPVEIADIRNAHIKEGVVMTRFLKWLDESTHKFPETAVHEKLTELREQQDGYLEPSFDTIAGYMSNGAIVHYSPKQDECAEVKREGFLLVDTGAQYNDGKTDITRTAVMGEITDEMKHDFTIVLKGHIALATAVFLKGTVGGQLDVLARSPFWREGLNYRHGTGHGIGYCLGVHEGPHHISMRPGGAKLAPGMLVTNEPGLYRDGKYGIRTENVMLIEERYTNEFGTFLGFETLSLCPIDLRAVDLTLLNAKEKDWLNAYHKKVYDLLSPSLTPDENEWLKQVTVAVILN
jgi:Xaa-Pro aminopeptidase